MNEKRKAYEFTHTAKTMVRHRAQGLCEFPPGCPNPNTNRVNHLTGVAISRRERVDPSITSNANLNALMLCSEHEWDLDSQEDYQLRCLKEERHRPMERSRVTYGQVVAMVGY